MTRRVAIVSPYFPPSTLAGVHRARHLARHLPTYGWEPTIVCVDERHHEETLDPALARLVPKTADVRKVGAIPSRWARPLGIGDLSLRGYVPIRRALGDLAARHAVDAVLVTMGPYYTALAGASIKRRYRLPLVLDYQDPWVSRWGATRPALSKVGASHRLAEWLEPRAVRWADHVTSVSEGTNREIRERYPALSEDRFSVMPIGGDPLDFDAAEAVANGWFERRLDPSLRYVSYVGTLLPRAGETLRAFLRAYARWRRADPEKATALRLLFVGTSNQPDGHEAYGVLPVAREEGVEDAVLEFPGRVPYLDALGILRRSTALLALGSDEPHYTASKIYPLLLSRRPVLAVFHEESSVCDVVEKAGGAALVRISAPRPALAAVDEIVAAFRRVTSAENPIPPARLEALAPFLADGIAGRFAAVLETVVAGGPRDPSW